MKLRYLLDLRCSFAWPRSRSNPHRAHPLRRGRRPGGNLLHPQFRRRETGLAARKHRRRRRLVRLQQRRPARPLRDQRQAARPRHPSLSAAQAARKLRPPTTSIATTARAASPTSLSRRTSRGDLFSMAAIAADYDNDGNTDLLVTGYGRVILYRNKGDGTFEDVTEKAGLKVPGWSIGAAWLDYDRDGCVDLFVGRYVKFDPEYRSYYAADNYPGPARLRARDQPPVSQQLQGRLHRCERKGRHRQIQEPRHGRHRGRFRPRRLPRYLRRQRQDRELPLPQPEERNLQGDRPACRRGLRTERREHFRHGTGIRGPRRRRHGRTCGYRTRSSTA